MKSFLVLCSVECRVLLLHFAHQAFLASDAHVWFVYGDVFNNIYFVYSRA